MSLVNINHEYIRAGATSSIDELEELAFHLSPSVRRRVAENNFCPREILTTLSEDSDTDVRVAVAEHKKTPKRVLFKLCLDECVDVRYAIACTPARYAGEVLRMLIEDENPYVVYRAQKSLSLLKCIA